MNKPLLIFIIIFNTLQPIFAQDEHQVTQIDSALNEDKLPIVFYKANLVFQYGGESKITLLPKMNFFRGHEMKFINLYYGVELGLHPLMIWGAYTISGVFGVEKGLFFAETSVSHYGTNRINQGTDFYGPFSQNSVNLKLGIQIGDVGIKFGRSVLISENVPDGQERPRLLDIGKINGNIYGIELSIIIC